jgi:hypothetical protein
VKVDPRIPKTPSRGRIYVMGAADFVPNNGMYGMYGITIVFAIVALQLCMGVWLLAAEECGPRARTKPSEFHKFHKFYCLKRDLTRVNFSTFLPDLLLLLLGSGGGSASPNPWYKRVDHYPCRFRNISPTTPAPKFPVNLGAGFLTQSHVFYFGICMFRSKMKKL